MELSADLATRLERNETPHRMECKASKRDVAWSKANLLKDATNHRLNLEEGEIWFDIHRKIDTTLQYAMVKQSNVKIAHRKYIG